MIDQRRFQNSPADKGDNIRHDPLIAHGTGRLIEVAFIEILFIQFKFHFTQLRAGHIAGVGAGNADGFHAVLVFIDVGDEGVQVILRLLRIAVPAGGFKKGIFFFGIVCALFFPLERIDP